jgi:Fe-Mn family superoxide dismutase
MAFELPNLPFDPGAMGDWSSGETFEYHHGKHHAAYVSKLNAAVEGSELAELPLEEVIAKSRGNAGVFNNAAQHWNHAFFWECLAPTASEPEGELADKLNAAFGSVDKFKEEFSAKAATLFGSGWAWLVADSEGGLKVAQYKDADTPVDSELKPLLTLDVWEHAYYIDHRNNRGGFIEGFWQHVDWAKVAGRL